MTHDHATSWEGPPAGGDPLDPVDLMEGATGRVKSPQCSARSKRSGLQCRRPVPGGGVCSMHGGRAPQVQRQREARLAVSQAQAMYSDEFEVRDPGEVLLAAVADGDAIVQKLKQQMQRRETLVGTDLVMLGDWIERTSKMSKAVLDLKLDERRVRMAERDGKQVVELLRGVTIDLGHHPDDPRVRAILLTRLRALEVVA